MKLSPTPWNVAEVSAHERYAAFLHEDDTEWYVLANNETTVAICGPGPSGKERADLIVSLANARAIKRWDAKQRAREARECSLITRAAFNALVRRVFPKWRR